MSVALLIYIVHVDKSISIIMKNITIISKKHEVLS